jgi:hypothetical protein
MDVVPCVAARTQATGIEIDGASRLFVKAKQLENNNKQQQQQPQ